jgi:hypothetical protein
MDTKNNMDIDGACHNYVIFIFNIHNLSAACIIATMTAAAPSAAAAASATTAAPAP